MSNKNLKKIITGSFILALALFAGAVYADDGEEHKSDEPTVESKAELETRVRVSPKNIIPARSVSPLKPSGEDRVKTELLRRDGDVRLKARVDAADDTHLGIIKARHEFRDGLHTVSGVINLPTPCHELETNVFLAKSFPEQATVQFKTGTSAEACAEVISASDFKVEFRADENASISATLNGEPVRLSFEDGAGNIRGEERSEEVRERNEERREETRARLEAEAKARVEAFFERMVSRIEAAFDRMKKLIERTESRIEKLEERGLETETSLELVAESKTKLNDAEADFGAAIRTMVETGFDSDSSREIYGSIKETVRAAVDTLKDSKELLKDAVNELKAKTSVEARVETEVEIETETEANVETE